ncbi:hypothetical protein ACFO0N_08310 [Halobium salinum]|uniref:Uncharacterized protein n=1 Tax=Halobium salinum TaxID=1364940 RepID=A0ABD5PBX3_9EURY|nr:hypothetical protein [Halobium salinum]
MGDDTETDLTVYRYDAGARSWTAVGNGGVVDAGADTVSVSLTEFGVVASFVDTCRVAS